MFKAIVEAQSHEGGLLAPFTGASPALGAIIVRTDDGTYIGKIDAVLGNTDTPIAHIAHLDRKINPESFLGCEAQIRPKTQKQDDSNRYQTNRYENRGRRDNGSNNNQHRDSGRDNNRNRHSNRRDSGRDNFRNRDSNRRDSGRDNFRNRDSNRRNSGRDNFRNRDSNRRDSGRNNFRNRDSRNNRSYGKEKKIFADNDWTCAKCNNSNFSFRKECNRCGEPKNSNSGKGNHNDAQNRRTRNNRPPRTNGEPRKFRKARGKSANHAHNRGPKPLDARSRRRNRDD